MNEEQTKLYKIVNCALLKFNTNDIYLISTDLNERCICSRLAYWLQNEIINDEKYHDYVVDVEYNRGYMGNELSPKRIDDKKINVDLIVHKRGYDNDYGFDNLICVEVKKSSSRIGCNDDEIRLCEMTSRDYGFCYKLGLMIVADMKECALKIRSVIINGNVCPHENMIEY